MNISAAVEFKSANAAAKPFGLRAECSDADPAGFRGA
jgi:hypothetical protein